MYGGQADIENVAKACLGCQSHKHSAAQHPWTWPQRPWQRNHIDFAGPFLGKSFLVVVDAHPKWPEVFEMSTTSAVKTIDTLRHLFAAYGLPEQVVSDNGPQFTAEQYSLIRTGLNIFVVHLTIWLPMGQWRGLSKHSSKL